MTKEAKDDGEKGSEYFSGALRPENGVNESETRAKKRDFSTAASHSVGIDPSGNKTPTTKRQKGEKRSLLSVVACKTATHTINRQKWQKSKLFYCRPPFNRANLSSARHFMFSLVFITRYGTNVSR